MVEIGFGARVVDLAHRLRSGKLGTLYRRWGDALYLAAALKALFSPGEAPLHVRWDDTAASFSARAVVVANTRCYAKQWAMAPGACMDDGRLDLVARLESGPGVVARAYYAAARRHRPPSAFSRCCRARHFTLQSATRLAIQVDGDPMPPSQWMAIDVLPGRLPLITPPGPG
jgi:diacylglycerol kinase family enzyme